MRLSDCFIDIIAYVSYFIDSTTVREIPFEKVRGDIEQLMESGLEKAAKNGFEKESYETAQFAICAWIDESLMCTFWKARFEWQKNPLQRLYFKTTEGGMIFFDKLNELRTDQNDIREVFYLCIALGYQGRFCLDGDKLKLDQLKSSNSKLLTGSSMGALSIEGKTLFPESYQDGESNVIARKLQNMGNLTFLSVCFVPVALLVSIYIVFNFILNSEIASGLV